MSLDDLAQAIVVADEEKAKSLCDHLLRIEKIPPNDIIIEGLAKGLRIVGEGMAKGELFLDDVIVAADTYKIALELLKPHLETAEVPKQGTIVIGTIYGDTHDIGKNLVATLLEANGFEVFDIGVDVDPVRFAQAAKEKNADIVGISCLLTTTMIGMREAIEELAKSGCRQSVRVMVGGACITDEYAQKIGADAYGRNAFEAVVKAKELLGVE